MKRLFTKIVTTLVVLLIVAFSCGCSSKNNDTKSANGTTQSTDLLDSDGEIPEMEHLDTVPEGFTGIYTIEDLDNIRNYLHGSYILMNDLDLSAYAEWNPIGSYYSGNEDYFRGVFNGNGYTISGMKIHNFVKDRVNSIGLFGQIDGARIENLIVSDSEIKITGDAENFDNFYAGLIVGRSDSLDGDEQSKFENCYSINSVVDAPLFVGGIVGCMDTTAVKNCYNNIEIKTSISYLENCVSLGGITGRIGTFSTIEGCTNSGKITSYTTDISAGSDCTIGGIAGSAWENSNIINCRNNGEITAWGDGDNSAAGGIIGGIYKSNIIVESCKNYGKVNFNGYYKGGICGLVINYDDVDFIKAKITDCSYLKTTAACAGYYVSNTDDIENHSLDEIQADTFE